MNQVRTQKFWAKLKKITFDVFHNEVLLNKKFIYE